MGLLDQAGDVGGPGQVIQDVDPQELLCLSHAQACSRE